jgi:transketolase
MDACKKGLDRNVSQLVEREASALAHRCSLCLNVFPAAISLAGHLGLDNLILIYDNNRVTVDGSIDNCFTEDTSAKLIAQGWHVIDVHDGSNDVRDNLRGLESGLILELIRRRT